MKRLVLHIGYPKNGSSALQVALRRNAPALAEAGIGYPLLDARELAAIEGRGFGSGNAVFLVEALRRGRPLAQMLAQVEAAPEETVILSTEAFGQLDARSRAPMIDWLRGLGVPVRLLAYRRDPFAMALSGYMQAVKGARMVQPLEHGCARFVDPRDLIRAVFAGFEIEERPFDGARADLVNDFLQWVAPGAPRLARPEMPVNRSLSREEVAAVICLNRSALAQRDIDAIVAALLREEMRGTPMRHCAASIRALSERLGRAPEAEMWRLDGVCAPDPEPGGEAVLRVLEATLGQVAARTDGAAPTGARRPAGRRGWRAIWQTARSAMPAATPWPRRLR